jgi:hypothetical protein
VQARLFLDTDGDFETWDPGALVATSTTSQVIAATDTLFTFNFSNETLSDNTVYVLSFYDGISDHVAFASDVNSTGSAISDGALFSSANQPFAGLYDAAIRVTTTSVPEVSSLVLGALAGMAAFMGLRHR